MSHEIEILQITLQQTWLMWVKQKTIPQITIFVDSMLTFPVMDGL
jgi:ligand-binding SRPBCC domain-containing protein